MLPESEMCRSDADVCGLMAELSKDLGVIDLKFTSESKFEFSLLKAESGTFFFFSLLHFMPN